MFSFSLYEISRENLVSKNPNAAEYEKIDEIEGIELLFIL